MTERTGSHFWKTIYQLLAVEGRKSAKDKRDEASDWADQLVGKRNSFSAKLRSRSTLEQILKSSMRRESTLTDLAAGMHADEVERFLRSFHRMPADECKFSLLPVRNKLEMLMGSNLVSLTDRDYMMYLQKRVLDDYEKIINKRIAFRKAEEMERVKNLVLSGRIPPEEAPMELANHPVMLITQYCRNVFAERRAKIHNLQPNIPKCLYWDDTPDPPSGLSIQNGHRFRSYQDSLYVPPKHFLTAEADEEEEESEESDGNVPLNKYMLSEEHFEELHYESPEIKELRMTETVEEMYAAADAILGIIAPSEETLLTSSGSSLELY